MPAWWSFFSLYERTNEVTEVVASEEAVACKRVEAEEPLVRLMIRGP
jgi:hypothetical protein